MLTDKDIREIRTLRSFVNEWPPCCSCVEGKLCGVHYRVHNQEELNEILEAFSDIE